LYNSIFVSNVVRLLDEREMTKKDLSEKSGVSMSFISDLTNKKANPSLKVMENIAHALDMPLPMLLESYGSNAAPRASRGLPNGYEHVSGVLPAHKAFIFRKWDTEARSKLTASLSRGSRGSRSR
jgi:transcriptional regulator with XRE-family HTH domain